MLSASSKTLLRSTSVRLSLVYTGLIVASFLLIGVVMWLVARHVAEEQVRQDIQLEVLAIETEFEQEGLAATIAAIEGRAAYPGALDYWLADGDGRRLAGQFEEMAGPDGWHEASVRDGSRVRHHREDLIVLTETLAGGVRLSVGDDLRRAVAIQDAVLRTLGSVGVVAVILCLVIGVLATRRVLLKVRALGDTFESVTAGNMAARYPADGSASDVEQIGIAVNRMLDRIENLVADVRRVSRDVAHDLRTPLTHLQQRLEQAQHEPTPAGRLAAIEGAQQKSAELLRIFDALLRLAEIEAGTARQRFKTVDLAAIADRIVDAYRPDIEESGHTVSVAQLDACILQGDEELLSQAVANLIENAMHHTPAGTNITLRVFSDASSRGFEVVDDGPGIPPDAHEHIKKPFMRLDQSRTTPGSGLGLSLVAAIARLHDAQLTIMDGQPGLRVSIVFP